MTFYVRATQITHTRLRCIKEVARYDAEPLPVFCF